VKKNLWRAAMAVIATTAIAVPLAACSSNDGSGGKVQLEIFQNKTEAIANVNELIKDFEKTHPNITVKQTAVQDAVTVLKSRLAKGNVPDLIALNVSAYYDLAQSGLLKDLSGTAGYKAVDDKAALAYLKEAGQTSKNTAVPWATNAQIVFYNVDQYSQYGLTPPTTWDEFIANAKKIKDAGGEPFNFGWKDSWNSMMLVNSVVASSKPDDLLKQLQTGKTTFATQPQWKESTKTMLQLKDYAQPDAWGTGYDNAVAGFADGKGTMLVNGTWALPAITKANPNLKLGAFVMPSPVADAKTKVPAGPDSYLSIYKDSAHPKEAEEFFNFLMDKPAQQKYADEQYLFSVRNDVKSDNAIMSQLKSDWIDPGKTATYSDGYFAGGTQYQALCQEYLKSGDQSKWLKDIDQDFKQYGLKPGK